MARITVLGGTGYAGRNIVRAAVEGGHTVVSYARNVPEEPIDGVEYRGGDVTDADVLAEAVNDTDVIISALSPRGELEGTGKLRSVEKAVSEWAHRKGVRFGVVGGAGSLRVTEGGPKIAETEGFPPEFKPEAQEMDGVLQDLRATDDDVDWFFVSPAGGFGEWAPGEATGNYRLGGDVLLVDEEGESFISGPDLGHAVVREIEEPQHRRQRFTVAY